MGIWIRIAVYFIMGLFFLSMAIEEWSPFAFIPATIFFLLVLSYWFELHTEQQQRLKAQEDTLDLYVSKETTLDELLDALVPAYEDRLGILLRFHQHVAETGNSDGFILNLKRNPDTVDWTYGGYYVEIRES